MQVNEADWVSCSMILAWQPMTTPPWRMRVTVAIVVVPDRAHIAGVGLEQEAGDGEDALGRSAADRAGGGSGRLAHRPLPLVGRPAIGAGEVVFRHSQRMSCRRARYAWSSWSIISFMA